jgi:hypothetical protein
MGNPPSAPEGSTEMLVRTKLVRTMFCALGASTLVLGGTTAPGSATGDHNDDEVDVRVCVRIDDGHNDEVDITVSTDTDDDEATIEDGDCETFTLEFDHNRLEVEADTNDDVQFRVFGHDVERWQIRHGVLRVTFDDDDDTPFVGVRVRVEDDHHHHHHG